MNHSDALSRVVLSVTLRISPRSVHTIALATHCSLAVEVLGARLGRLPQVRETAGLLLTNVRVAHWTLASVLLGAVGSQHGRNSAAESEPARYEEAACDGPGVGKCVNTVGSRV